ncbi:MAG: alkaline phosphatase family protein [Planctomycetes bacterium]|nr:alkaline phosphatase family protein [Planctomycetota bacterium]
MQPRPFRSLPATRARWIPLLVVLVALAGCGVPAADGPDDTYFLEFDRVAEVVDRADGAILFFVDGVNPFIFQEMLDAGQLPAIKKYFVDRGLYAPRAVVNIPSVTLANETSVVTAQYPGHHGITGINWFDRNQLIWRDYEEIRQKNYLDRDHQAATIFEQFPDRTTISIFLQAHRGATHFFENWTSAGPPFFFKWYDFVDRLTLFRFKQVIETVEVRREFPAFTVAYLLAPDFRAYQHGVKSDRYREALLHTDKQIGRVLGDVEHAGLLDKLTIALISDHSLSEVTQHFPIHKFLQKQVGLDISSDHSSKRMWEADKFQRRRDYFEKFSTVLYGSGDRYWALCLRKPRRDGSGEVGFEAWPVRPDASDLAAYPTPDGSVNLIAALVEQEAVDAVAYAMSPDVVRLVRKEGEVEFSQSGGRGAGVSYRLVSGTDPLGWNGHVPAEMLDGSPHSPRQWLAATVDTQFPGLPAQIVAYFRAHRAGDLVAFAAPGWDFRTQNRAGHGGLRPGEMLVPMMLAGPGVPHGMVDVAQTVDMMPTLLHLLGRPIPSGLDGSVLPEVKGR